MPLTVISADSINRDSYIIEPLGVRGAAEALLRHLVQTNAMFGYVSFTPGAVQSLKKAAKGLADEGLSFNIEKMGTSRREVTITREKKDGSGTFSFTREYLNTELLSIENRQYVEPSDESDS